MIQQTIPEPINGSLRLFYGCVQENKETSKGKGIKPGVLFKILNDPMARGADESE